jgi:hypothetical protein
LLENQTSDALHLSDFYRPSFNPYTWLEAEVDGKEARLLSLGAFTIGSDKAAKKLLPKGSLVLGEIAVMTEGKVSEHKDGYVPMLIVEPGEHELRFTVSERMVTLNKLGKAPAAMRKVKIAR